MATSTREPIIHCKYDALVDAKDLKHHPKNRNKHDDAQLERLAKIIQYQGWRYPVKVSNLSGFITTGHGRTLVAELAKWKVPVVYQDYTDSDQEYADVQSDNAIASWAELDLSKINLDVPDLGPDFDIDCLGIKDFSIDAFDKYADKDADEIPEVKESICKAGDLWILGNHRLLCGDATKKEDVERLMNGESADMVYTDPPYGIDEETDRFFSARSREAAGGKYKKIIGDKDTTTAKAILPRNEKIQVIWGANYFCHSLPESGNWLIWDKREDEKERNFNSDCEMAWVKSSKNSARIFRHKWKGMIKASEHGQARVHPTQKPIALAEWCFNEYGATNIILDFFLGSGSTLIACEKTNRKCFGMEIDPHYCDVIIARWEKFTGQKAVKHE